MAISAHRRSDLLPKRRRSGPRTNIRHILAIGWIGIQRLSCNTILNCWTESAFNDHWVAICGVERFSMENISEVSGQSSQYCLYWRGVLRLHFDARVWIQRSKWWIAWYTNCRSFNSQDKGEERCPNIHYFKCHSCMRHRILSEAVGAANRRRSFLSLIMIQTWIIAASFSFNLLSWLW